VRELQPDANLRRVHFDLTDRLDGARPEIFASDLENLRWMCLGKRRRHKQNPQTQYYRSGARSITQTSDWLAPALTSVRSGLGEARPAVRREAEINAPLPVMIVGFEGQIETAYQRRCPNRPRVLC
jgi:hypothetical protein